MRLAVPLIGPAKVFHLLGLRPAGRTKKRRGTHTERRVFADVSFAAYLPDSSKFTLASSFGLTVTFWLVFPSFSCQTSTL